MPGLHKRTLGIEEYLLAKARKSSHLLRLQEARAIKVYWIENGKQPLVPLTPTAAKGSAPLLIGPARPLVRIGPWVRFDLGVKHPYIDAHHLNDCYGSGCEDVRFWSAWEGMLNPLA